MGRGRRRTKPNRVNHRRRERGRGSGTTVLETRMIYDCAAVFARKSENNKNDRDKIPSVVYDADRSGPTTFVYAQYILYGPAVLLCPEIFSLFAAPLSNSTARGCVWCIPYYCRRRRRRTGGIRCSSLRRGARFPFVPNNYCKQCTPGECGAPETCQNIVTPPYGVHARVRRGR